MAAGAPTTPLDTRGPSFADKRSNIDDDGRHMIIWGRVRESWTVYWAVHAAMLLLALAAGLATATGRLHLRPGAAITAILLVLAAAGCYRGLRYRMLRERARPLAQRAFGLGRRGRSEEAIASCDEVLGRFGPSSEQDVKEQVAKALDCKGTALGKLGRLEEAVAIYDEVARRFGRARERDMLVTVGMTAVNRGLVLGNARSARGGDRGLR